MTVKFYTRQVVAWYLVKNGPFYSRICFIPKIAINAITQVTFPPTDSDTKDASKEEFVTN